MAATATIDCSFGDTSVEDIQDAFRRIEQHDLTTTETYTMGEFGTSSIQDVQDAQIWLAEFDGANMPATEAEIQEVRRQLAAVEHDPDMTITLYNTFELPEGETWDAFGGHRGVEVREATRVAARVAMMDSRYDPSIYRAPPQVYVVRKCSDLVLDISERFKILDL